MAEPGRSEPPRKRNRISKVCIQCKRRKVKCDMKHPCLRCLKSGLKCEYKIYPWQHIEQKDDNAALLIKLRNIQKQINDLIKDSQTDSKPLSLLDMKVPSLKKKIIMYTDQTSHFLGPSCRIWLMHGFPLLQEYMHQVFESKEKEKKRWLQNHSSEKTTLDMFGITQNDNAFIQRILIPNVDAFRERIIYFQNYLNSLIFRNCMPMDIIHSIFMTYFENLNMTKSIDSIVYGDLSLIIGVVYITYMFTRLYPNSLFQFHLSYNGNELLTLFLKLLNLSRFRTHKMHTTFLSLLILCQSLLLCKGSVGTHRELDSYPVFQICFNMCIEMGFHQSHCQCVFENGVNLNGRIISFEYIRKIWNFMQTEDGFYSVMIGTPLLIDYSVSSDFYLTSGDYIQTLESSSLKIQRNVSSTINSCPPISINMIVDQIKSILKFCETLPSIDCLNSIDLDTLAFVCRQKFIYMEILQCLCRLVTDGLTTIIPKAENVKERTQLQHLSHEMFRKCLIASIISLYTAKSILQGSTVFQSELNDRYIVYFRDMISTVLGHCGTVWFTYILPEATGNTSFKDQIDQVKSSSSKDIHIKEVTIPILEKALFTDESLGKALFVNLLDPSEFIDFFDDTFSKNKVMKSSFESFLTTRGIAIWSYVLKAVQECKELLFTGQTTVFDIMKWTQEKLMNEFDETTKSQSNLEEILDPVIKAYDIEKLGNTDDLDSEAFFNLDDLLKNYQ